MTTNFFQSIEALKVRGDWKITVKQGKDGHLIVSVLLSNDTIGDDAHKSVPPMIFKGTAQEMDDGFFKAVTEPVQKTAALFANMEQYMKSLEEARLQSKMEQDKENKEKKEKEERKKKYADAIKKVDDFEEKKQYQAAIAALPKAEQFPEQKEEIVKRLEDLRKKNGQLALM